MNWLRETAWPFLKHWSATLLTEWWVDIGDKPRPHFVSMVMGVIWYWIFLAAVKLVLA